MMPRLMAHSIHDLECTQSNLMTLYPFLSSESKIEVHVNRQYNLLDLKIEEKTFVIESLHCDFNCESGATITTSNKRASKFSDLKRALHIYLHLILSLKLYA
jgi:hypothetical protein